LSQRDDKQQTGICGLTECLVGSVKRSEQRNTKRVFPLLGAIGTESSYPFSRESVGIPSSLFLSGALPFGLLANTPLTGPNGFTVPRKAWTSRAWFESSVNEPNTALEQVAFEQVLFNSPQRFGLTLTSSTRRLPACTLLTSTRHSVTAHVVTTSLRLALGPDEPSEVKLREGPYGCVVCFVQLDAFYTEPLEFIKSHMPLVGRWQLTPAPVAKEDFWRDARAACDQATSVSPERTVEASSLRVLRAEKERAARGARRRFPELDVIILSWHTPPIRRIRQLLGLRHRR